MSELFDDEKLLLTTPFCRTCLTSKTTLFSFVDDQNLLNILTECTSIQIHDEEEYAFKRICVECKRQLLDFHRFRTKCLQSDTLIQKAIKVEPQCDNSKLETQDYAPNLVKNEEKKVVKVKGERCRTPKRTKWKKQTNKKPDDNEDTPTFSCAHCMYKGYFLNQHMRTNHSCVCAELPCDMCAEKFYTHAQLEHHVAVAHVTVQCDICEKTLTNANSLKRHRKAVHNGAVTLACHVCGKVFKHRTSLARHVDHHNGISSTPRKMCNICGLQFTNITLHVMNAHHDTHPKTLTCRFCGAQFAAMSELRQHSSAAHAHEREQQPRNHECALCGKRFSSSSNLVHHHKSAHNHHRPFACSVCDKRFKKRQHITQHMRLHTDERPYACDLCEKRFRERSTMTTHRRIHTGVKPYACAVCEKAFTQRTTLMTHMKVHAVT